MPVPKRRKSISKSRMQRASNMKVVIRNYTKCFSCGTFKLGHYLCRSCGKYASRIVINIKKE